MRVLVAEDEPMARKVLERTCSSGATNSSSQQTEKKRGVYSSRGTTTSSLPTG